MRKSSYVIIATVLVALIVSGAFAGIYLLNPMISGPTSSGGVVRVVAGENFWGSLITQLGGTRVSVTSIVSDPNADPHEYEPTSQDARTITDAQYVIYNGVGYDPWMDNLLSANPVNGRAVLNTGDFFGKIHETIDGNRFARAEI